MALFEQPEILSRYLENHSSPEEPVLAALSRHTHLREAYPNMLSGPILGGFLRLFSQLVRPERILEIGTYTGYSTICLARGLRHGGRLITIEKNDELRETSLSFFERAGLAHCIQLVNGDARDVIPGLTDSYDLVFIDGDKECYPEYYDLVAKKVRSGGYILADNTLWSGEVLDKNSLDPSTLAIQHFNEKVTADPAVENLLLSVRDGIMVIRIR